MPTTAPSPMGSRKRKLFLKFVNRELMEEIRRSKIPRITAIVPPLTPGIMFATPTKIPLIKLSKKFMNQPLFCIKFSLMRHYHIIDWQRFQENPEILPQGILQ